MQNKDFEIGIVEDDSLVSLDLLDRLESLGFSKISTFSTGESLLKEIETTKFKVVLMDIELAGKLDGIETVQELRKKCNTSIIYLTDHVDDKTFQRALTTSPAAFLHKPFIDKQIAQNIEIAATLTEDEEILVDSSVLVPDGIFAFLGEGQYQKILFDEICFLKAERAYCEIGLLEGKPLTVSRNMGAVLAVLSKSKEKELFIQVHRSYVINKRHITGFNGKTLLLGNHSIPTTEFYVPDLKARFFTI
ncbi:two component transcriptional regulator, LytTR family [Reichenbachiella faecimaris]|uniref:Two component transcriptional regulator, LytTR family n=1 Tax=Reichenbachiella faecimaris TaxID=692418 RepID=A0A1W2GHC7_REIFA|nr:response regulator transcription factor [Reichenbachiella faecimaris]SMD36059.1 two component transcriptional regulator, LytTR family [Reichenbachiella faecimaris]